MNRLFHMTDSRAIRLLVNLAIIGVLVEIPFTVIAVRQLHQEQVTIHQSQITDALAVKTYIACLLTLDPQASQATIHSQEQACFNKAPEVK